MPAFQALRTKCGLLQSRTVLHRPNGELLAATAVIAILTRLNHAKQKPMRYLVMLEDDLDRIRRFRAIVATHHPDARLDVYRTAPAFIAAYSALTSMPCLVCLDHDVFVDSPDEPDPGDGRDVSTFLTTQPAICPVLIHSTNAPAADGMMFSMRDAGWTVDRIAPIGGDWIEAYWYPAAYKIVSVNASPSSENGG
jgi:hypothetical protein